eukprot:Selendium_serpulae@DN5036_c0_g1_i2.p1
MGIGVYGLFCLLAALMVFSFSLCMGIGVQRAAVYFHTALLDGILSAPMSFFDSTPTGRILNRFSKDTYVIDEQLPGTIQPYLTCLISIVATATVISFVTPMFIPLLAPMAWFYVSVQNYYIPTSRQLQRLNSVLRSPIFSNFSETLDGAVTIRAFNAQQRFKHINTGLIDAQLQSYYMNTSSNRWLSIRLESLAGIVVAIASLLTVVGRNVLPAGLAGLAISYSLNVTQQLAWVVRMASDRENYAVSVERVIEYCDKTASEAPAVVEDYRPHANWPDKGEVVITDLCLRYRPHLPLVLNNINVHVLPGEKVGIVGRTGAGKSSLLLALLRLVEPSSGTVVVDGLELSKMGLRDLRSRFCIIPQDPVIFAGTLRFNLDPNEEHNDEEINEAIQRAHLVKLLESMGGLDAQVEEGGRNVSMGQRQLLCLGRALLRRSRILLLDEATSAVDPYTDKLIQSAIQREFGGWTVLTIAHRINTIVDYDKILFLDGGRVVEYGTPGELFANPHSRFRSSCVASNVRPPSAALAH